MPPKQTNTTQYMRYLRSVVLIEGCGLGSPAKGNAEEYKVHTEDSAHVVWEHRRENNQGRRKLLLAWAWKNM